MDTANGHKYNYENAVSRNIGLFTEFEQILMGNAVVAIAGVGAVGGNNLITLARLGICNFKIADPDIFEEVNLQRQAGSFISSINKPKVEIMQQMVLDINPTTKIEAFSEGITEKNIDQFLENVDIVLDGIDAFQIGPRRLLYKKAREKGVFVIFSAPKAYGATLQIFDPRGMSFDEYFGINDSLTRAEQIALFLLGVAPLLFQKNKIDGKKLDFENEKAPALASTVCLSAGIVTSAVLKILLNREKPKCIPHAFFIDPYHWKFSHTNRRLLRFRWLQKIVIHFCLKKFPSLKSLYLKEKNLKNIKV